MSDDNWQMLRTSQLFIHDNCQKLLQIYHQKFETISQFEQQFSSMMYLNKFKQMQISQATQSVAANVHPQQQQQQTPTTPNNIDTIKQQTPSANTPLASTITSRVNLFLFSIILIN